MAKKLAHTKDRLTNSQSDGKEEQTTVDRRKYLQLSGIVTVGSVGMASGLSAAATESEFVETFSTDFSEYSQ